MAEDCKCCSLTRWESPVTSGVAYLLISLSLMYSCCTSDFNPLVSLGNVVILSLLGVRCLCALGVVQTGEQDLVPSSLFEGNFEGVYKCVNKTVGRFHEWASASKAPLLAAGLFAVVLLGDLLGTLGFLFWTVQVAFGLGAARAFAGLDVCAVLNSQLQQVSTQASALLQRVPRAKSVTKQA